ncbi:MAG: amidohydrolase family protein [Clostridiales bacterium]|nr:amidohydrolase family protein [Clostridiales bacterium]
MQRLSQVAQQFPKLTIIAAHMGGAMMWDQVEEHLLGKDLYFDPSLSARFCPPEQYVRMIRKHDSQRILFASDSSWSSAQKEFEFLQSLLLAQ